MKRALLLTALALAACSKDDGGAKSDDTVVAEWKRAGLEVSPLTEADAKTYDATTCRGGTVAGVDVVLCTYDSGEDAKAAEEAAIASLTDVTGAAIAKGNRLLVVADRRKSDPSGRSIDAITRGFRK